RGRAVVRSRGPVCRRLGPGRIRSRLRHPATRALRAVGPRALRKPHIVVVPGLREPRPADSDGWMLLQDKVVIVSGVGPGLGQANARALAREGATVVLAASNGEYLSQV